MDKFLNTRQETVSRKLDYYNSVKVETIKNLSNSLTNLEILVPIYSKENEEKFNTLKKNLTEIQERMIPKGIPEKMAAEKEKVVLTQKNVSILTDSRSLMQNLQTVFVNLETVVQSSNQPGRDIFLKNLAEVLKDIKQYGNSLEKLTNQLDTNKKSHQL